MREAREMDLREGRRKEKTGGCGRKEGRCPAGSSKEVVVGGGSRHMGAVEKINRSEEKSRSTVESASRKGCRDDLSSVELDAACRCELP